MNITSTKPGVYRAECEGVKFLLSVVRDRWDCLSAVAAYIPGTNRPSRRSHQMLTPSVREWLEKIDLFDLIEEHH